METKILIALITAVTSITIALISLLSSYFLNMKIIRSNRDIERLKLDLDRKRLDFQLLDENLRNKFSAFGIIIGDIQKVKDYLLLIENSGKDSMDVSNVEDQLGKLRNNFFRCYQDNSHFLEKETLAAAHSAKTYIFGIENLLKEYFIDRKYTNISSEERLLINNIRYQLTEFQNIFRDERARILNKVS